MTESSQLSRERKERFNEALSKSYKGALFDIDGTLTPLGEEEITNALQTKLASLVMEMPIAVCTARRLKHAFEAIAPIFKKARDPKIAQKNWYFICENGCIGHYWNAEKKEYEEFYRSEFPYPQSQREDIFIQLKKVLGDKIDQANLNDVNFSFKPAGFKTMPKSDIAEANKKLVQIIRDELFTLDPMRQLTIGNSGMGIYVFPSYANKENGTFMLADYLRRSQKMIISENCKELITCGDKGIPGGNDESFLNGKYGTPFTVGLPHPTNVYPMQVYDLKKGNPIIGPEGTLYLINHLKWS